jgi:cobalt/nickel transport system ATP-binding protein
MIQLYNLSYTYPDGTQALDRITFALEKGTKTAILGPNGAGKSTLIRLLNGTIIGDGRILIDRMEISKKSRTELHQKVGVVFQNPDDQLFCPTIFEDVAFGPLNLQLSEQEIKKRVRDALNTVGLAGYEQRSSFHLSFGERKSASLATVLAMKPLIYIFDEPSANLDPFHRRKIITFIQKLNKTILIATHDLDLVLDTCNNIVLLNKGKLIKCGDLHLLKDETLLTQNKLELPLRYQK